MSDPAKQTNEEHLVALVPDLELGVRFGRREEEHERACPRRAEPRIAPAEPSAHEGEADEHHHADRCRDERERHRDDRGNERSVEEVIQSELVRPARDHGSCLSRGPQDRLGGPGGVW